MAAQRTLVTLEELSAWMTERVQAFEDCAGTTVTVQYRLQSPDKDGCNWSENVVFNPGPNAAKETVLSHVGNLVREARGEFNVKD
jgi:hypothetical protein